MGVFMEVLSYKIESFEGPMDLLLHLISKHKVKIEDVPIMELVEQYLDYVRRMKEENLEVLENHLIVSCEELVGHSLGELNVLQRKFN